MKNSEQEMDQQKLKKLERLCSNEQYSHHSFSLLLQETDDFIEMLIHKHFVDYQIQILDKEDVKQDILIKLHQKLANGKYQQQKGHSIKGWIYTVVHNHFIDIIRSANYRQQKQITLHQHEFILESILPPVPSVDKPLFYHDLFETIMHSLQELEEEKQYAIREHLFYNTAFSQLSKELGKNQNTVQGWYFRWKEKLRNQLDSTISAAA